MTDFAVPPTLAPAPADVLLGTPRPRRPWPRRARVGLMRAMRVSHRWIALVLGLLLLVVTTSGALLLFKPELERRMHPYLFHRTASAHPLTAEQALALVQRERPALKAMSVGKVGPVWGVDDAEYTTRVYVDPGTGHINGQRGEPGVFRFLDNLHECALSCEGYPGYVKALGKDMPSLGIPGLEKVTIAGFVLGVAGLAFVVLTIGGLILWWPGIRRWRRGFEVRRHKGRYGRDYDLHKLVGFVALPFLALWAFTGTNFELPVLRNATDAVLPGGSPDEEAETFRSLPPLTEGQPDITVAEARTAALGALAGGKVVNVSLPAADDPTATYSFCVDKGINWWRGYDGCPAGKFVSIDRRDATRVKDTWHTDDAAQALYGKQTEAAHFGAIVGWIPRLGFLVMGLVPLLLAVTGTSTWLVKRAKRREAKRRRRAASPAPAA